MYDSNNGAFRTPFLRPLPQGRGRRGPASRRRGFLVGRQPEIIIGLIIIAIGSFCQSSSYVPIKKVKEWSWESFWLLQGVFA